MIKLTYKLNSFIELKISDWLYIPNPLYLGCHLYLSLLGANSHQISPKVSLMLRMLDLRSLARLTNMSGKVWDLDEVT